LFNNAVKSSVLVFGSKWNEVYCKLAVSAYYLTKQFYTSTSTCHACTATICKPHFLFVLFLFWNIRFQDQELSNMDLSPRQRSVLLQRDLWRDVSRMWTSHPILPDA